MSVEQDVSSLFEITGKIASNLNDFVKRSSVTVDANADALKAINSQLQVIVAKLEVLQEEVSSLVQKSDSV